MTSDNEDFFMFNLPSIYLISWSVYSTLLLRFFIVLFIFLLTINSTLSILDIQFANIFSQALGCLFIFLLILSFEEQMLLVLESLSYYILGLDWGNLCLTLSNKVFLLCFFYKFYSFRFYIYFYCPFGINFGVCDMA